MSGLKVTLPTAFTDTSLPIPQDDGIFPAGNGPLVLLDMAHSLTQNDPSNPLALTTPPATGLILPNIAYSKAAAMIGGSPSRTALSPTLNIYGSPPSTVLQTERSGKGGIHGIVSNTNATTNSQGMTIGYAAANAIPSYVYANIGHQFYWSIWARMTRPGPGNAGVNGIAEMSDNASIAGKIWFRFNFGSNGQTFAVQPPPGPAVSLGSRFAPGSGITAGASLFGNFSESGYAASTSPSLIQLLTSIWGKVGGYNNQYTNIFSSWIFYRFYAEDLTVSGRSYATVDALDYALAQAAFASGGKYNTDTYTAPSN